jgi:hypothetical protein
MISFKSVQLLNVSFDLTVDACVDNSTLNNVETMASDLLRGYLKVYLVGSLHLNTLGLNFTTSLGEMVILQPFKLLIEELIKNHTVSPKPTASISVSPSVSSSPSKQTPSPSPSPSIPSVTPSPSPSSSPHPSHSFGNVHDLIHPSNPSIKDQPSILPQHHIFIDPRFLVFLERKRHGISTTDPCS